MLEAGDYSLQPEEYNRTFPLTILEDAIPEATESIRFTVEQSIYSVNIMDNDSEWSVRLAMPVVSCVDNTHLMTSFLLACLCLFQT